MATAPSTFQDVMQPRFAFVRMEFHRRTGRVARFLFLVSNIRELMPFSDALKQGGTIEELTELAD